MQAIALAGGLSPFAARQRISFTARLTASIRLFIFDFNAYLSGANAVDNINLQSGDIIIVPERGLLE